MVIEAPLDVPRLSVAERDRRWTLVRAAMRRQGVDCLICPEHTGGQDAKQGDHRYLTSIGGGCAETFVIFPLEGEVTCIIRQPREVPFWKRAQDWVSDVRASTNSQFVPPVVQRLNELGLARARIGVVGLEGTRLHPEGIVTYTAFVRLQQAFPGVSWVNATDLVQEVRIIKSEEEIALLQRGAEIIDCGMDAICEHAQPGISEQRVYAAAICGIVSNGGEVPFNMRWGVWPNVESEYPIPTHRPLERGDIIRVEMNAKWAGYVPQRHHAVQVGAPISPVYAEAFRVSKEAFERVSQFARPGVRVGECIAQYRRTLEGTPYEAGGVLINGRGLGEDQPHPWVGIPGLEQLDRVLAANMVFILKPSVGDARARLRMSVGDTVVVTEAGLRRLSKRPLDPIVVGD